MGGGGGLEHFSDLRVAVMKEGGGVFEGIVLISRCTLC